jgi:hypothetical protein
MRGKLPAGHSATGHPFRNSMQQTSGNTRTDGDAVIAPRVRQCALWVIGLLAVVLAAPGHAQNIDAGKSPAQIFNDTCGTCHRRAQDLKHTSASFLRSHYTTGSDEAATMAGYLASLPSSPRAAQPKRQPGVTPPEAIPTRRQDAKEQPKDQAKSTQTPGSSARSRRNGNAEAKSPAASPPPPPAEVRPPEPPPEAAPPPPPPLDPFEE